MDKRRVARYGDRCNSGSNPPRPFTAADAPPAAVNRALRRACVAEANRMLRRTDDPDAARRAGADVLVAASNCNTIACQAGKATKAAVSISLPIAATRRERNRNGEADRVVEANLAGERP